MFSNNKAAEQVKMCKRSGENKLVISECFSLTPFGYHIKFKHVFSDVTEQKCLRFSQVPFWDGTTYLQRKGWPFHCNIVGYA